MSEPKERTMLYLQDYFRSLVMLEKDEPYVEISSSAAAGNYHDGLMINEFCDEFEELLAINAEKVGKSNELLKQKNLNARNARRNKTHDIGTNLFEKFRCRFPTVDIEHWKLDIVEFFSKEIENASETLSGKNFTMQKPEKADVHRSASTWNYDMFNNYIEDLLSTGCQFTFPKIIKPSHLDVRLKKIMSNITQSYEERGVVLCCISIDTVQSLSPKEILAPLTKNSMKEEAVKEFFNAMLIPILHEVNAKYLPDLKLESKSLPSSICDYVVYNHLGQAIGVIEAKARGKLNDKSVVQCLLQLLSLQKQERICKDFFGIVTDAYHFIFILLKQKQIMLFADEEHKCHLWKNDTWENMENIVLIISSLCQGNFLNV